MYADNIILDFMENKIIRQLIEVEIRLGFLSIPARGIQFMPSKNGKIDVLINGHKTQLSYNSDHRRVFGLTKWYKQNKAKPKDEIELIQNTNENYELKFIGKEKQKSESEEAVKLVDLSGLSSQAKGNIVEDRVKESLLLYGQGLLSVYKPVTDTEGIDLIVVRNGRFNPIFLQVKGRFNLDNDRSLILRIKVKTFTPHSNYFVVGAFFNPKTLEIDKNILLIPSKDIVENATKVKSKGDVEWYNVATSIADQKSAKWTKYLIRKDELASKLLEKFEEISKYIK